MSGRAPICLISFPLLSNSQTSARASATSHNVLATSATAVPIPESPSSVMTNTTWRGRAPRRISPVRRAIRHRREDPRPDTFAAPSAETPKDAVPGAECIGEIAPRHTSAHQPQDGFNEKAVVATAASSRPFVADEGSRGYRTPRSRACPSCFRGTGSPSRPLRARQRDRGPGRMLMIRLKANDFQRSIGA